MSQHNIYSGEYLCLGDCNNDPKNDFLNEAGILLNEESEFINAWDIAAIEIEEDDEDDEQYPTEVTPEETNARLTTVFPSHLIRDHQAEKTTVGGPKGAKGGSGELDKGNGTETTTLPQSTEVDVTVIKGKSDTEATTLPQSNEESVKGITDKSGTEATTRPQSTEDGVKGGSDTEATRLPQSTGEGVKGESDTEATTVLQYTEGGVEGAKGGSGTKSTNLLQSTERGVKGAETPEPSTPDKSEEIGVKGSESTTPTATFQTYTAVPSAGPIKGSEVGSSTTNPYALGPLNDSRSTVDPTATLSPSCPSSLKLRCQALLSPSLAPCVPLLPPEEYVAACEREVCQLAQQLQEETTESNFDSMVGDIFGSSKTSSNSAKLVVEGPEIQETVCEWAGQYAEQCRATGLCVAWRETLGCPLLPCPLHSHYQECGQGCDLTCGHHTCQGEEGPACYCDSDMVACIH